MKKVPLIQATERVVALKMQAIDRIIDELIEPISMVGNPEKLIKKPYEQWTPEDLQLLTRIYGQGENTPLSNLAFRKIYEQVKALEAEEE